MPSSPLRSLLLLLLLALLALSACGTAHTAPTTPAEAASSIPQGYHPTSTPSTTVTGHLSGATSQAPQMPTGAEYTGSVGWTLSAEGITGSAAYAVSALLVSVDPVTASSISPPAGHDWLLVALTVTNRSATTPYVVDRAAFRLVDAAGTVLATPTELPTFLPPQEELAAATLAPGKSESGALLYAVPSAALQAGTVWLGWEPAPSVGMTAKFCWALSL